MADIILCPNPSCQARLKMPKSGPGKKIKCPKCAHTFVAAQTDATASTSAPSPVVDAPKQRPCGADGILEHWEPRDLILDLYEVREMAQGVPFAEGGMGRVNRVWHKQWQTDLAVKSVNPDNLKKSAQAVDNFKQEAEEWVNKIGLHPHIVGCYYVRILGGLPRVFVEFVDGGSLKQWINARRLYEGGHAQALERILDVAIQFAWGLHYVHELGLIHQDVKPDNVMVTAGGIAKVTDFGLANARAAAFDEEGDRPAGSSLLATFGGRTEAYCSYEQADIAAKRKAGVPREKCQKLTRRTDLWSWAVSVLEMFTGEVVWPSGSVADRFLKAAAVDECIPEMPPAVTDLLRSCFQQRPVDRPHDMLKVADSLRDIYLQVIGQPYPREMPRVAEALADTLNNRAVSMLDLAKPEQALKLWDEALKADPHHLEATYNSGMDRWRRGQMNEEVLLVRLRAFVKACPDDSLPSVMLTNVYLEQGNCQAALQALGPVGETDAGGKEIQALRNLAEQLQPGSRRCHRSFEGHTDWVNSVCLSGDSRFALSGSTDNTLKLWEVSTGRCLRSFEGHTRAVMSVCLSGDGRFALSGSVDYTLKLWFLDWDLEIRDPAEWDEGARPHLETFLARQTPYVAPLPQDRTPIEAELTRALTQQGKPAWTEEDFQQFLYTLGCAGYGWLQPEGVRRELTQMAATWKGPPPLS